MTSVLKPVVIAAAFVGGIVGHVAVAAADQTPVIGANNTTYSPKNFSGRWKLRQSDGEICLVELKVTDTSPHDLGLRACTDQAIISATQWEMRNRDLVFFAADGGEIGPFKVTEPNKLEGAGMILFR